MNECLKTLVLPQSAVGSLADAHAGKTVLAGDALMFDLPANPFCPGFGYLTGPGGFAIPPPVFAGANEYESYFCYAKEAAESVSGSWYDRSGGRRMFASAGDLG